MSKNRKITKRNKYSCNGNRNNKIREFKIEDGKSEDLIYYQGRREEKVK